MQKQFGIKNETTAHIGLKGIQQPKLYWNISAAELTEHAVRSGECVFADSGALVVDTGEFTGRSPKDRFIVKDATTANTVHWGKINIPFDSDKFDLLHSKVQHFLDEQPAIYVRDAFACANPQYRLSLRLVAEKPWEALFAHNMFMRPTTAEVEQFDPEWTILAAPSFKANPEIDGTRQHNFVIINFTKKIVLIGGTAYTGEIKKSIFSILNYLLPHEHGVLSMHCSANVGESGDTALFFGLSGTGKTTLSADPNRQLIGDDEHGWSDDSVFNFEGGCYAKCIDLTQEKEPQIYDAIRFCALLENTNFLPNTRSVNFSDSSRTENTRVSYPLYHIDNVVKNAMAAPPQNIFFLTCDAWGILPPISRLTPEQAMYHFMSGYTAKVAGTEKGIVEPVSTFSACFGNVFLPLHPAQYASMLGEKLRNNNISVWLINTGWIGGEYGKGERIKLSYTRAMITAALNGDLDNATYDSDAVFGLHFPNQCPNVPTDLLNPRNMWIDKAAYDSDALELAKEFIDNFEQYADQSSAEIAAAGPKLSNNIPALA